MLKTLVFCNQKNKALFHGLLAYSRLFDIESVFIESCNEARQQLQFLQPAALIVEVTTSDAAEIRQFEPLSKAVPLFAVSAMTCETVAVAAYQNGAVTFIRLPCGSKEFYYRLLSVLKNCYRPPLNELHNTIDVGNIKIYTKSNRVMLNNEIVHLTPSEYNLLLLLAQNVNQTVSTEEMYNKLWSTSELRHTSRGLQMHLSKLRRKLNLKQDQQCASSPSTAKAIACKQITTTLNNFSILLLLIYSFYHHSTCPPLIKFCVFRSYKALYAKKS